MSEISIYETNSGSIEVRLERETVWLSQEQMAALFDVQKAAVSKHLRNIFASGELERDSTVSKMETVQQEGKRRIARQIEHFNPVSYTHLRAHETVLDIVCRLLLEKKNHKKHRCAKGLLEHRSK